MEEEVASPPRNEPIVSQPVEIVDRIEEAQNESEDEERPPGVSDDELPPGVSETEIENPAEEVQIEPPPPPKKEAVIIQVPLKVPEGAKKKQVPLFPYQQPLYSVLRQFNSICMY